jgi:hypothetical protein
MHCRHVIEQYIYSSLIESQLRFGAIIYGAASPNCLDHISILQRKAIRLVANVNFLSHTDQIFKSFGLLKYLDIIHLDQTIFMRQYDNKLVPSSLQGLFNCISPKQQKSRGDYYNFESKQVNHNNLLYYPNVQLIRSYNRNTILIKSQSEIASLKQLFITEKIRVH